MNTLEEQLMECMYSNDNLENKLQTLQNLYSLYSPKKFDNYTGVILNKMCEYGHLPTVSWLWSIENKYKANHFYVIAMKISVVYNHFHIIQYLYENVSKYIDSYPVHLEVFNNIFYNIGFMMNMTMNNNEQIAMIDFIYNLFKIEDSRLYCTFTWACHSYNNNLWGYLNNNLLVRAKWIISKKPYHFILVLDETQSQPQILKYDYSSKKEIRWNSLKTVLWMSQVKPENPHKSSIFRFISDDVIKAEICSFICSSSNIEIKYELT